MKLFAAFKIDSMGTNAFRLYWTNKGSVSTQK